jgi:hypothetical protein
MRWRERYCNHLGSPARHAKSRFAAICIELSKSSKAERPNHSLREFRRTANMVAVVTRNQQEVNPGEARMLCDVGNGIGVARPGKTRVNQHGLPEGETNDADRPPSTSMK